VVCHLIASPFSASFFTAFSFLLRGSDRTPSSLGSRVAVLNLLVALTRVALFRVFPFAEVLWRLAYFAL